MKIAVTGAAGFIGGITVLKLVELGHTVYACDLTQPSNELLKCANWFTCDIDSKEWFDCLSFAQVDAIIHCGGTSLVGPSILNPRDYYENNFIKTKNLLDHLVKYSPHTKVVFSSSAAIYGIPKIIPIDESTSLDPISPYGESKAMIEWMLKSYQKAYNLSYVSFRYFNACGADIQSRHGQQPNATHIIARIMESIINQGTFTLYGNQFQTKDGTCVRDYIHVDDIANAHIMACEGAIPNGAYNLGNNIGYSNLDVVSMIETVTSQSVKLIIADSRPGDPDILIAKVEKIFQHSNWRPKYDLLNAIIHAWKWYSR